MVGFWDGLPVSPVSAASEDTLFKTTRQSLGREACTERPLSPPVIHEACHRPNSSESVYESSASLSTPHIVSTSGQNSSPVEFVAACEKTMDVNADFVARLNTSAADSRKQIERRRKLMERLEAINKQKKQLTHPTSNQEEEVVLVEENLRSPNKRPNNNTNNRKTQSKRKRTSANSRLISRGSAASNDSSIIDVDAEPPAKQSRKKRSRTSTATNQKSTSTATAQPVAVRHSSRVRRPRTSDDNERADKRGPMPLCMSKCKRMQFCKKVVMTLLRDPSSAPFSAPVKDLWPEAAIPRYFDVIKRPIDLGTIKKNFQTNIYICQSPEGPLPFLFEVEKFADDVRQVFRNAHIYNRKGDAIYNAATTLLENFENTLVNVPAQLTVEEANKERPKRGRGKGRARKSKTVPTKESDPIDLDSDNEIITNSRDDPASSNAATEVQDNTGEESDDFMDDGMTAAELKDRLSYLQRCRVPVIARTPVPEGSGYLTRAALLYAIEMKWEEKKKCMEAFSRVPPNKLPVVIDMIREGIGHDSSNSDDGEFVFDADQLDNKTMRNIQAFMEDNVPKFKSTKSSALGKEFNSIEVVDEEIEYIKSRLQTTTKPKKVSKPTNVSNRDESFFKRNEDHGDSSSSEDESSSDDSESDDDSESSDEE